MTTATRTKDCPDCEGTGEINVGNPSGYFDASFGNYLPDDRTKPCEECDGSGEVEDDEPMEETDEDNA